MTRKQITALAITTAAAIIVLGLTNCSGVADAIKQAKGDNATWCLSWSGFGVSAQAIRLNPLSTQDAIIKCPTEIQQGNTTPPPTVNVLAGGTNVMQQTVQPPKGVPGS